MCEATVLVLKIVDFSVIFILLKVISILTAITAMNLTQMLEYSYRDS